MYVFYFPFLKHTQRYGAEFLFTFFLDEQKHSYATDQILLAFGCDFAFGNAYIEYKNMEKLMAYINANASFGETM